MFLEYQKHNLFILPSSNEPFGYAVLKAMACGLPIICSDTAGVQWYIEEGKNGYIFKSDDLKDLAEKIRLIVQDKDNIIEMGRKSYELVLENHSPEKFYKEFMNMIKNKT